MKKYITCLLMAVPVQFVAMAGDLKLKFDKPAEFFEESFVIGNGRQGGIIYGKTDCERISLNDITLWSGEPDTAVYNPGAAVYVDSIRAALAQGDYVRAEALQHKMQGHNSQYYQPVGNLFIDFNDDAETENYRRQLDLQNSIATVEYTRGGKQVRTSYLASAPDSLLAVNITSDKPMDLTLRFDSPLPHHVAFSNGRLSADGYAPYGFRLADDNGKVVEKMLFDPARGIHFRTNIAACTDSGEISGTDSSMNVSGATDLTIYIVTATSFGGSTVNPAATGTAYMAEADRCADMALSKPFDDVRARHIADYRTFFDRVQLDLGESPADLVALPTDRRLMAYTDSRNYDPDLEELYFQYGRYLLISSSRTAGIPANLQGLWNENTFAPWRSNYTVNINLEENYWPAEVTNLGEMHMPLMEFIRRLSVNGATTAREYYGIDRGWCTCHNSDVWAMTCPVGHGNDQPMWANWNMGGAWLASHIWQHYLYSRDEAFLREYYPLLKGAAEFCLAWLVEDADRNLITSPSTSPENRFRTPAGDVIATSAGGYADLAMIRECLADTRSAAEELGTDQALITEIDGVLPRLAPYRIGANGQLQEWAEDFVEQDPQHRHQSHLYGLYPGHHISVDATPELAAAAARTLEIKGDNTTGWSTGWRVNLLARLKKSAQAYAMYRRLLKYVSPDKYQGPDKRRGGGTYPNLLDAHSPFQIDGNFGGTAGVAEMLMQSTPESITLLPALPENWKNGSFRGLCARGGFTVDASWRDGRVVSLKIASVSGGSTTVNANGESHFITLEPGGELQLGQEMGSR